MATISTSSTSTVLALLAWAALASCATAADTSCPPTQGPARLKTVSVFDGPPSEMAELRPDSYRQSQGVGRSEWDVAYIFRAGRRLSVNCDYGPNTTAVTLEPDPATTRCVFLTRRDGTVSLTCSPQ